MAALLVGMSVAAVLVTVVMPTWRQMTQREKEAELVFRGQQYVRAIGLFQKKAGPGVLPPSVDVLVQGHYLRKKFKDPITNDDFELLSPATQAGQNQQGQPQTGRGQQPTTSGFQPTGSVVGGQQGGGPGRGGQGGDVPNGGIIGVTSKSKATSIRLYNGRTHYNEWQFIFVQQQQPQAPGAPGAPGQPGRGGAPPVGPGQNGRGGQLPPSGFQGVQGRGQNQGRGAPPQGQAPQGGRGAAPPAPSAPPASIFAPRR